MLSYERLCVLIFPAVTLNVWYGMFCDQTGQWSEWPLLSVAPLWNDGNCSQWWACLRVCLRFLLALLLDPVVVIGIWTVSCSVFPFSSWFVTPCGCRVCLEGLWLFIDLVPACRALAPVWAGRVGPLHPDPLPLLLVQSGGQFFSLFCGVFNYLPL